MYAGSVLICFVSLFLIKMGNVVFIIHNIVLLTLLISVKHTTLKCKIRTKIFQVIYYLFSELQISIHMFSYLIIFVFLFIFCLYVWVKTHFFPQEFVTLPNTMKHTKHLFLGTILFHI